MGIRSVYNDIRNKLQLGIRVVSQHGEQINVDETFTLKFTASNQAQPANHTNDPIIVFKNPRVWVSGRAHAEPVQGSGVHDLPKDELFGGESTAVEVEFRATSDLPFFRDIRREEVAEAYLDAKLDQDQLFRDFTQYERFRTEIRKT